MRSVSASAFDSWMAVLTVLCIGIVAVFTRGMLQRLLILVGLIVACALYALLANGLGLGKPLDFSPSPRRRGSGCRTLPPHPLTARR
ncbi:hypothetical protein M3O75_06440 [Klebsiella pneumoniae]|nr:hypothetical protein [Klebsiella pneumoniae]